MHSIKVVDLKSDMLSIFSHDILVGEEPVVLRDFVSAWPSVARAKDSAESLLDYLAGFDSGTPVLAYTAVSPGDTSICYRSDYSGFSFDRANLSLQFVADKLRAGSDRALYVGSTLVDKWLPGFRENNDVVFGSSMAPSMYFWLGNQTTISVHNDTPHNLACCVAGHRTFTLFPPEQLENLYLGPVDVTPAGRPISLVDFANPDFTRFPKFRQALEVAIVAELGPGDALYIPPHWWHHVKGNANINMLVNYWWRSAPRYMGSPDLALEHAILALRGLPDTQKAYWKSVFDYYIFGDRDLPINHIPSALHGMLNTEDEQAAQSAWLKLLKKLKS